MAKLALEQTVQQLIDQAKTANVSDTDIQKTIRNTFGEFKRRHPSPHQKANTCRKIICSLTIATSCLFIFMIAAVLAISYSEWLRKVLTPIVFAYASHVLSAWRHTCVFMTQNVDAVAWAKWNTDQCFIENPYKKEQTQDMSCTSCKTIEGATVRNRIDRVTFESDFHYQTRPLKSRLAQQAPLSFKMLKENYEQYSNLSQAGVSWIESPSTNITNVTEFMRSMTENSIVSNGKFHAEWHMVRPGPAAFLRKFFPMPDFFPTKVEFGLHNVLLIDSSSSGPHEFPQIHLANLVYMQGYGQRNIHFAPKRKCRNTCSEFTVTMETGDMLYFDGYYYKVDSRPVSTEHRTKEVSIAFLRSLA